MKRIVEFARIALMIAVMASLPLAQVTSQTCLPPSNVQMGIITHNSAQVTFVPDTGAQFTQVHFREAGTTNWITATGSWLTYTMHNLADSTQYELELRSKCSSSQYSTWTPLITFTTLSSNGQCPPPAGITVMGTTNQSANISWIPVPGVSLYFVQYKPSAAITWNSLTASTAMIVLANLQPNTSYDVKVRSYCSNIGQSSFSPVITFITGSNPGLCNPPTGISVSNVTANAATLVWSPVIGALHYSIQYREVGVAAWSVGGTAQLQYMLTGLTDSTQYEVQLRSNCGTNINGPWSPGFFFTTLSSGTSCPPPSGITVSGTTMNSASLSWNPVPGAINYYVYYKPASSTLWTYNVITNPAITIFNLAASTQYDFRIRTFCPNYGLGGYSATGTFATTNVPNPCLPPGNISVANITASSATLSWSAVPGVMQYQIRYRQTGSPGWLPANTNTNGYALNGLADTTDYELQVRSHCASNAFGAWSPIITFTTLSGVGLCPPPTGLQVTAVGNNFATISWTAVPGVNFYYLYYKKITALSWMMTTANTTFKTLFNLADTTQYEYKIRSYCQGAGLGASSATGTFTTTNVPNPCTAPTSFTVTNITAYSARINWLSVPGVMYYQVHYRAAGAQQWHQTYAQMPYRMLNALQDSTTYEYRVRSGCGFNSFGAWSATGTFTTLAVGSFTCLPPTAIAATNITMHAAKITWIPVPGAYYYRVQYRPVGSPNWLMQYTSIPERILHNLIDSMTYEVQLSSYCGANAFSAASPVFLFTTPDDPNTTVPKKLLPDHADINDFAIEMMATVDDPDQYRSFVVYPNPAAFGFRIKAENMDYSEVQIYNVQGKLMRSFDFNAAAEYPLDHLAPGIYFIRISDGNQLSETQKLMIE